MTAASVLHDYERQQSSDSGWDNPFRPDGDLSREADQIVSMITGGKRMTPGDEMSASNGKVQKENWNNDLDVKEKNLRGNENSGRLREILLDMLDRAENQIVVRKCPQKYLVTQNQYAKNGSYCQKPTLAETCAQISSNQISKQILPGPTSASHVIIDEKSKKNGCCIIQ